MKRVMINNCFVALGANLPTSTRTPAGLLRYALKILEDESLYVAEVSRWYQTPAFPSGSGPDYVNAVAKLQTRLEPHEVLARLAETEEACGRKREGRWGARVCDLDLLSFGDRILPDLKTHNDWVQLPLEAQMKETPCELILPHPRIQDRAFVLVPLKDVAPDWRHPVTGQGIDALISELNVHDVRAVRPMDVPRSAG